MYALFSILALIFYKMAFIFYIKMAFIFYILVFTESKITECKTACKTVPIPKLCKTWTFALPCRDSQRRPAFDDVKSALGAGCRL